MPIPAAIASRGERNTLGEPATRIAPASGCRSPNAIPINVDLAGAVLAQQCVDPARSKGKIHVIERGDGGEVFGDAGENDLCGRSHNPVGTCKNDHGNPNSRSVALPRACTPNVSVA